MLVCASCGHDNSAGARFCERCGAAVTAFARATERRKTVTVLFCDLAGSTALGETVDPERLRALLARYFERMQSVVERHGGSVEKFIGDAVMAVFGVPVVHEDDALRAVRAAAEMRDTLPELGLEGRIGVMTGEVVTGTEERLATGDAVNVAARLEQAAQPGEVLLGEPTFALVRDAVEVEPLEPLELKGKAERVPAYRLTAVREGQARRSSGRFVGRKRELALVGAAWEQVRSEKRCERVTVAGEPGVGKSRLVAEAVATMEATTVGGRCLPYGEGITYWPVVEVLMQLDVLPGDEAAAVAIRSLLGAGAATPSAEELAWAFRKTLETAAAQRPVVVVFDDIQWGEGTFLDLIEHVALLSSGAPILVLCIARPELSDRRPEWPVTVRLGPLGDEEVDQLIPEPITRDLRGKIARAAAGNPLFVEEMLSMAGDTDGEIVVPPNLHALLAARLDGLDSADRSVLERGAVEGEVFHRGAVQALARDELQVTPRLASLVRKELIRRHAPHIPGDDAFRFRHLLIRDAAYDALPKSLRADLHARFASWLEEHATQLVELDELVGYHLEQACRYHDELDQHDDELASAARLRLTSGGHRAQLRSDYGAAASLYERAAALVAAGAVDLAVETELGDALMWAGRGSDALRQASSFAERAAAAGDRVGELCARIKEALYRTYVEAEGAMNEQLAAVAEQALPVFEAAGDAVALYTAHQAIGWAQFTRAQTDSALLAYERAAIHAARAGLPHELLGWRAIFRLYGSTPAPELLAWLDEHEPGAGRDPWLRASRAMALAMVGRADDARAILADTRAELAERGGGLELGTITGIESALVEFLAGDAAAAAEFAAEGCRMLDELGEEGFLSTAAGELGRALYELDRLDDAELSARRAAELGASDDAFTQMVWRGVSARVAARRGNHAEAERLAREALAISGGTDDLNGQADASATLAEVLVLAGRTEAASAALEGALERYERKGNIVMASRVRERLATAVT